MNIPSGDTSLRLIVQHIVAQAQFDAFARGMGQITLAARSYQGG